MRIAAPAQIRNSLDRPMEDQMKFNLWMVICFLFAMCLVVRPKSDATLTGDQALQKLIQGNKRYRRAAFLHPDQSPARRAALAKDQKPFAIILGCSDARVPPEVIFDQGLGNMSVMRVGGN